MAAITCVQNEIRPSMTMICTHSNPTFLYPYHTSEKGEMYPNVVPQQWWHPFQTDK